MSLIDNSKIRSMVLDGRTSPFFSTVLYMEMPNELIVTEGFNSLTLNLSNLSNAVYYVSIFNDIEQVLNKKIILNEK